MSHGHLVGIRHKRPPALFQPHELQRYGIVQHKNGQWAYLLHGLAYRMPTHNRYQELMTNIVELDVSWQRCLYVRPWGQPKRMTCWAIEDIVGYAEEDLT